MITAIKYKKKKRIIEVYEDIYSFANKNYNISINSIGGISVDGKKATISYSLNSEKGYTKEEALKDFISKGQFKKIFAKEDGWKLFYAKGSLTR